MGGMAQSLRTSLGLIPKPSHKSLPLFLFYSSTPTSDYLINHHSFSPSAALKASSVIPHLRNPSLTASVLSFLTQTGFSHSHLESIVQTIPRILCANLHTSIQPKILVFQDLAFSRSEIIEIISCDPWILCRSPDKLGPALAVLKSIMGSNAEVCKFLKISRRYLQQDLDKSLKANIELLEGLGISSMQLVRYMFRFPRLFLQKREAILEFVDRVDKMEFDRSSRLFISAIGIMSSLKVETLEVKKRFFLELGFSEKDVFAIFRRAPMVFCISEKKFKEVVELLASAGLFDVPFVVSNPELLMYSVEGRLKPRMKVLEILERKKLLKEKPKLNTVCKYSEKMFAERFILPYANELEFDMTYKYL